MIKKSIVLVLLALLVAACGNESQSIRDEISSLQNLIYSQRTKINSYQSRLREVLGTTDPDRAASMLTKAIAESERENARLEATLAALDGREQNILKVSKLYTSLEAATNKLESRKRDVVTEYASFINLDKQYFYCGDQVDCIEDLDTLVRIREEVLSETQGTIQQAQALLQDWNQQLVAVSWQDEADRQPAQNKLKGLIRDVYNPIVSSFAKIKRDLGKWSFDEHRALIDEF